MDTAQLRNKLKLRNLASKQDFARHHPHVKNFFDDVGLDLGRVREHSAKLLTAGALGSSLLLSPPLAHAEVETAPLPEPVIKALEATTSREKPLDDPQGWLVDNLRQILPPITSRWALPFLTPEEEKVVGRIITQSTGVPAVPSLEGEHLNTVYGYTGYEQHLQRFPGDTLGRHDEFREAGMAPGLGGWGYFNEGGKLTEDAILREKYYVAVQTLYLPDWNKRLRYLIDWYKWRKVIMVNVENGNAVVSVVGDAGPASWTGKHFGGSPEVMNALGGPKYRKGRVLLYFVDDPENKIPLGPVNYSNISYIKLPVPLAGPVPSGIGAGGQELRTTGVKNLYEPI